MTELEPFQQLLNLLAPSPPGKPMTPEEIAAQKEEKRKRQEDAAKKEAERKERARKLAAKVPGVMGVGKIPIEHHGREVFEWEQDPSDVNIYIPAPPGRKGRDVEVKFSPKHLKVGLKGKKPYFDNELGGVVHDYECAWTLDEGVVHIIMGKAHPNPWPKAVILQEEDDPQWSI